MKKYLDIYLKVIVVSISLGLAACGGSDWKSNTSGTGIYPVSKNLDGGWTICSNDIASGTSGWEILDIKGSSLTQYLYLFDTLNCTGDLANTIKLAGNIEYQGQQITSTCTAEKTNTTYTSLAINNEIQSTQVLTAFLQEFKIPTPDYDISCVYSDRLFSGAKTSTLDGTTDSKRPTTIDLNHSAERL